MIYFNLIKEFFITGLFSFGGGYSTIPFLLHISDKYGWFSQVELSQMLAISAITPGPVGINMATFAGLKSAGILGALCATFAEVLPSLLLVVIVANLFCKFRNNRYVQSVIFVLKPVSCALLVSVIFSVAKSSLGSIFSICLFFILFLLNLKFKKSPLFYFFISGIAGVIYGLV